MKRKSQAKLLGRYIVADPEICHEKPVIRGTRLTVESYNLVHGTCDYSGNQISFWPLVIKNSQSSVAYVVTIRR